MYAPTVTYTFKNPLPTVGVFHFSSSRPNFFAVKDNSTVTLPVDGEIEITLALEKHPSKKVTQLQVYLFVVELNILSMEPFCDTI